MKYTFVERLLWILLFCLLAVLPMIIAVTGQTPERRDFWIEFGVMLGFLGFAILAIQFVLTGRFRWFAAGFGLDNILQFHRQTGIFALLLVLAHPAILMVYDQDFLVYFDPRANAPRALSLSFVTVATVVLVASSLWRLTFRLSYEKWRMIHGLLSLAILVLGTGHIIMVSHYSEPLWKQAAFSLIAVGAIYLLAHSRVVRPFLMRRRPYQVAEVRSERNDSWTLVVEAKKHPGMSHRPGQFAWITVGDSPFSMQQHPFSFASGATSPRLEFTIKELGDFTASVKHLRRGDPVWLEGPYGAFTFKPGQAKGAIFIAGGVGITPIMSMLRTFRDQRQSFPMTLVYGNRNWEEVIFREEIEKMSESMPLEVVHVVEEPLDGWEGETGLIRKEILERHLPPDRHDHHCFVCGPTPMMDVTELALKQMGFPPWNIYSERFDMV